MDLITIIKDLGIIGLIIAMFLEGTSLPFPGVIAVLSYGAILKPTLWDTVILSIFMSLSYTSASFIPYFIGRKAETYIRKKFEKKINKAQSWFQRFGMWSILLSRPFTVGNYISYVAGISRIAKKKFFIYTFLGIFPWSIAILTIGKIGTTVKQLLLKIVEWLPFTIIGYSLLFPLVYSKFCNYFFKCHTG